MLKTDNSVAFDASRLHGIHRVLAWVASTAWALEPQYANMLVDILSDRAMRGPLDEAEIRARLEASPYRGASVIHVPIEQGQSFARAAGRGGDIALLPLLGILAPRAQMIDVSGPAATGLDRFMSRFRAAADDPGVKTIIIDFDSPGGSVSGVTEAATEIAETRDRKRVIAVANNTAVSGAYWIASAATEVVVSPSGFVGGIGVFSVHEDQSEKLAREGIRPTVISAGEFKTEANPWEPLSDEAREELQKRVGEFYSMFVADVAKFRGKRKAEVRDGFGRGRTVMAGEAVSLGMADRVSTLDRVLIRLGAAPARSPIAALSVDEPTPEAQNTSANLEVRRKRLRLQRAKAGLPLDVHAPEGAHQ